MRRLWESFVREGWLAFTLGVLIGVCLFNGFMALVSS